MSKTIDFEVVKKFDQRGPRYTSYPTAPMFSQDFTAEDFRREIVETNTSGAKPISLYFHSPFCAKLCYFCGCNMMVTRQRSMIRTYNDYLKKDIDLLQKIVVELCERLQHESSEKNKYRSLLRELLESQRNRKSEQLSKDQLALFETLWKASDPEADQAEDSKPHADQEQDKAEDPPEAQKAQQAAAAGPECDPGTDRA